MALVACPDCQTQVSDAASACPKCGRPVSSGNGKRGTSSAEIVGALLFLGGVAGALYFFRFFETAVPTGLGHVYNLGLMQERQQGMMVTGLVAGVGLVLMIAFRKRV